MTKGHYSNDHNIIIGVLICPCSAGRRQEEEEEEEEEVSDL